jgi:hypothetical protein
MSKASHSRARARTTPPSAASERPSGPPMDTVSIASGPNTSGPTDQVSSVHVDEDGFAPADAATEIGQED